MAIRNSTRSSLRPLAKALAGAVFLILCSPSVVLVRTTVTLPIEVVGDDGTTASVTVDVPAARASGVQSLRMQIHNLGYADMMSVQVNATSWVPLNNTTVTVAEPGKSYGGIGGGYSTLTVTLGLPAGSVVGGANTIRFRFNRSDGRWLRSDCWRLRLHLRDDRVARIDHFQLHLRNARTDHVDVSRRRLREIDDAASNERTSIGDAHIDFFSIVEIANPHPSVECVGAVSGGEFFHVVHFTVRAAPSVIGRTIPTRHSRCGRADARRLRNARALSSARGEHRHGDNEDKKKTIRNT